MIIYYDDNNHHGWMDFQSNSHILLRGPVEVSCTAVWVLGFWFITLPACNNCMTGWWIFFYQIYSNEWLQVNHRLWGGPQAAFCGDMIVGMRTRAMFSTIGISFLSFHVTSDANMKYAKLTVNMSCACGTSVILATQWLPFAQNTGAQDMVHMGEPAQSSIFSAWDRFPQPLVIWGPPKKIDPISCLLLGFPWRGVPLLQ